MNVRPCLGAVAIVAVVACASSGGGRDPSRNQQAKRPGLVVMIAVDQLRGDLLDRYDAYFTGGFRRLRDAGLRFRGATVDHAITVSHPGHVTLATGMYPAHHGIVDGAWSELRDGHWTLVDPVVDSTTRLVGFPNIVGASPRRILSSSIADWIAAADPEARTVAVGLGQYASVLHAGARRGDVYWFDRTAGQFVTSTYYRDEYPAWVEDFQREVMPGFRRDSVWTRIAPAGARALALPDTEAYENDGVHTFFPHRFVDEVPASAQSRPNVLLAWQQGVTPFLDGATLLLAQRAVSARELGRRGHTDYLSIVVSEVDEIGHSYGPLSQEQLENLLRLDAELGEFFTFLDKQVGRDNWLVALTADHGVADPPEAPNPAHAPRRRLQWAELESLFVDIAKVAQPQGATYDSAAAERVARIASRRDFVASAMPLHILERASPADSFATLYLHSFRRDRLMRLPLFSPARHVTLADYGVIARLTEGTVLDLDPGVHMSPYMYDRTVPIIFMGAGIAHGISDAPAHTVDVAPTLARLAGVRTPAALDGHALLLH